MSIVYVNRERECNKRKIIDKKAYTIEYLDQTIRQKGKLGLLDT